MCCKQDQPAIFAKQADFLQVVMPIWVDPGKFARILLPQMQLCCNERAFWRSASM